METFTFVGGRQDGNNVPIGQPSMPEMVLPLQGQPNKGEVYVLESDGRYHFKGYRDNLPNDPQVLAAWKPHVKRIGEILKELDALIAAQGGKRTPIQLGRWTLQPNLDEYETKPE